MTSTRRLRQEVASLGAYAPAFVLSRLGPRSRFVVLGPGRCGSRLLMSMLGRQRGVQCAGEILNPLENRIRYPFRWVQSHALQSRIRGARAFGFKLLVHHLRDLPLVDGGRAFVDKLAASGYLVVVLTRRNLLRQAVSWERAQLVGRHHYTAEDDIDDRGFHLDPVQLILRMALLEMENEFALTAGKEVRHIEVSYEDDLLDSTHHQATVDEIMAALDVPSGPVRTPFKRGSPTDLHAQIANWDEVADVIGRTRYADFLTD